MKSDLIKISSVFLSKAAQVFSAAALTFLIAKILGPSSNGIYSLAILAVNSIAIFSSFGLPTSVNYYLVKSLHPVIISRCLVLQLQAYVLINFTAIVAMNFLQDQINIEMLLIISVFSFSKVFIAMYQGVYYGISRFERYSLLIIIHSLSLLIVVAITSFFYVFSIEELLIIQSSTYIILAIFLHYSATTPLVKSVETPSTYELFIFGLKSYVNNLISFVIYRVELLIITFYLTVSDVGIYSLSISIIEGLSILTASIVSVYFNRLINDITPRLVMKILCSSALLALFSILLFRYFILEALVDFLGDGFSSLQELTEIMLYILLITSITKVLAMLFVSQDRQHFNTFASLVMLVTATLLGIILIPELGLTGAALANLTGNIANLLVKIIQVKKFYGKYSF